MTTSKLEKTTALKARLYLSSDNEGIWLHRGHLDFTAIQGKIRVTSDEQMLVYDYEPFSDPINDAEDFTDFVRMLNGNVIVAVNIGIAGGLSASGISNYLLPMTTSRESVKVTAKSIANDYTMLRAQNFIKAYNYVKEITHLKRISLHRAMSYRFHGYCAESHMTYIDEWNNLARQGQDAQLLGSNLLPYSDNVSIFEIDTKWPTKIMLLMYNGDNNTWYYLIKLLDSLKDMSYIAHSNNIQSDADMVSFVDAGLTWISKELKQ